MDLEQASPLVHLPGSDEWDNDRTGQEDRVQAGRGG